MVLGGETGPPLVDPMCGLEYDPRALQGSQHISWCGPSKIQTEVKKLALSHELWFREYRGQGGGLVSDLFDPWHHMIPELGRVHPVSPLNPGLAQVIPRTSRTGQPCVLRSMFLVCNHWLGCLRINSCPSLSPTI